MSVATAGTAGAAVFAGVRERPWNTQPMGIRTQALREAVMRDRPRSGQGALLRDRFELLVPLGSGGFGTVWEGFDMLLERSVAIKELPVSGDVSDAADALREARATARLNHPAIVSLYEIVAERDRIYMIGELVHGSTLDVLIDDGYLSDHDCGRIGMALCEALAHAHAQGVVHRDVKPANVMVTGEWIDGVAGWRAQPAKLMDFGISSIVDREGGSGPHAGSRGYVAPEQEAGDEAAPAGDVYSLALVLFECFADSPPAAGRRGRLARVRRDLPIALSRCIDRCLESDPELRPPLAELAAELENALPLLSDELHSRGPLAWLRRLLKRGPRSSPASATSGSLARGRAITAEVLGAETPWSLRLSCAALAALAAALLLLAAGVPLTGPPIALPALLVCLLPRAGWAPAMCAGSVVLIADGYDGAALFVLLAACVAGVASAVATSMPVATGRLRALLWPDGVAGALWGVAAFLWVLTLQAVSGEALLLAAPRGTPSGDAVAQSLPNALDGLQGFATLAYFGALLVWALAGSVAVLLWRRRARLLWWTLLTAGAIAAHVAAGTLLGAMVPPLTLIAAPLAATSVLLLVAAFGRRGGRVFGLS